MGTKFGDRQERQEGEVLPLDEALGGAVKGEQVLMVSAPDRQKEVITDRQQRHELHTPDCHRTPWAARVQVWQLVLPLLGLLHSFWVAEQPSCIVFVLHLSLKPSNFTFPSSYQTSLKHGDDICSLDLRVIAFILW